MSVRCLFLDDTDPYLNLATEEFLLKETGEELFLLWRSEPVIVVGKHQNALAEINHRYVQEEHIRVARRLSGGGTVFHDPGNLNFTFIKNADRTDRICYEYFTRLIIGPLEKLGLPAWEGPHNAIFLGNRKISGSADHVWKRRVLHHGTLLFDSRLERLQMALETDLSRFEHKAVQSNRSEVTNIAGHLTKNMDIRAFSSFLMREASRSFPGCSFRGLDAAERKAAERLREEKYCRWDWIYGYSPKYRYHNRLSGLKSPLVFSFSVEKGRIRDLCWEGGVSETLKNHLTAAMQMQRHEPQALRAALDPLDQALQQEGLSSSLLLDKLF
ncbi:MAG: biotin/lipoate A/B protein ligase family protein [Mangrovibacterium sp.]